MKQKIINGIVIVIVVVVMAVLILTWPSDFNREFIGIKYQRGQDNQNYLQAIKVTFEGEFHSSYFGLLSDRFTGNIHIDGVDIYKNNSFEISFDDERTAIISHRCLVPEQRAMKVFSYGKLYLSEDMDALVIELFDDYSKSSINRTDGYVIAAPANSKEDAISIVNDLVDH